MTDIVWNFPDASTHILVWMLIGCFLYMINLCLLMAIYYKTRVHRGCCDGCNAILSAILLCFFLLNILTLIFMASNNGIEPVDYKNFAFDHDNNYTINEKMYFVLYMLSFNTFNVYCIVIVCIGIVNGLHAIKPLRYAVVVKICGILTILIDIGVRITCILFYCTPLIDQKAIFITTIFLSSYSLLMLMYFIFVILIFAVRAAAQGTVIANLKDDYLYDNGLGHLSLLHLVLVIWYVSTLLYLVFAICMPDNSSLHTGSLWIELLLSFILNLIVLYYLVPSKGGANISDNVYDTKKQNRRVRAESLSKPVPGHWRKHSNSYKAGGGNMYYNIHESTSGRHRSINSLNKESSYNKGGFIHNREREHSWFDRGDNVYGTPESSVNIPDKETTPLYMKQGVYDIPNNKNQRNKNRSQAPKNKNQVVNVQQKETLSELSTGDLL